MVAGVKVIASAMASAAFSAAENSGLFGQSAMAAIFSSGLPAALLPAALLSIQNGQVTICAARRQTSERSSAGRVLLFPGAALSVRLASRIAGQRAWMPTDAPTLPVAPAAASISGRAASGASSMLNGRNLVIGALPELCLVRQF
jgi:hypothetical protein